jgi:hypothetical protein
MARYYPDLSQPALSKVTGSQVSWSRQQIVTRAGVVFIGLGLESAARGINWEEIRPDVIIIDDIDELSDSVQIVKTRLKSSAQDIFPAGQENTWIVFAQNVIHSQSVMRRTLDGTSGILIDHDCDRPRTRRLQPLIREEDQSRLRQAALLHYGGTARMAGRAFPSRQAEQTSISPAPCALSASISTTRRHPPLGRHLPRLQPARPHRHLLGTRRRLRAAEASISSTSGGACASLITGTRRWGMITGRPPNTLRRSSG